MAEGLRRAIELADTRTESAIHSENAARVGIEHNNGALHHRHLTQGVGVRRISFVVVVGLHRLDQNDIADRNNIRWLMNGGAEFVVRQFTTRPFHFVPRNDAALVVGKTDLRRRTRQTS